MELRKCDESDTKEFVRVLAIHGTDGSAVPWRIKRDNGIELHVSRVLESRKAASLRAGQCGMRHKCRVVSADDGYEFILYIFHDYNFWFIEVTNKGGDILSADGTI